MKKTSFLFATIISIIFFCGLPRHSQGFQQSTQAVAGQAIFADDGFIPEVPKFKGCKAKCVSSNTQRHQGQQGPQGQQNPKHKAQSTSTPVLQHFTNSTNPSSIIALSPAITEIIYAIGGGDDIIAVSDFCNYPPEAKKKQKVGGAINPSYEQILVSKPDLIIYQGVMAKVKKFCENYKIPTYNVQLDNWKTITNSIQQIGNKTGYSKSAVKLRNQMAKKWNKIRDLAIKKKPIPVLVCVGRETGPVASCTTIGKNSFINEALTIAGGSNVCEDVIGAYPTISAEIISSRQPSIIFELRPGQKFNEKQIIKEWEILNKSSRIIILTNNFLMVPGPRITKIAEEFRKKLK